MTTLTPYKWAYDALFGKREAKKPYEGELAFNRRTIVFEDSFTGIKTSVQLRNVSKFELYGLKFINQISVLKLVIAGIVTGIGLYFYKEVLAWPFIIICGGIVFMGIRERLRPKIYGLTIQLNSGSNHHFFSKDFVGVKNLFSAVQIALENDVPISIKATFHDNRVTFVSAHNVGAVGDMAQGIAVEHK